MDALRNLLHRLIVEDKPSVASRNHTSPVALPHSVSAIPLSVEGVALSIHDDVVLASFTSSVFKSRSRSPDERSMKCHLHTGKYTQVDRDNELLADHIHVI